MDVGIVKSKMAQKGMKEFEIEREISFALQSRSANKQLMNCTPESFMSAIVNVANVGLSLNPTKQEAYLIARYNFSTKEYNAILEPSYKGLIKLACVGSVTNITSNLVYENDEFKINIANNNDPVLHFPNIKSRGNVIGVYAIAFFENGTHQAEFMSVNDINKIRSESEGYKAYQAKKIKSCPWVDWYSEMARKVVIKRLCKYLPGENEKLLNAIEIDNQDYRASLGQLNMIESLLQDAMLPEQEISSIEDELFGTNMSRDRAIHLISRLKNAQPINVVEFNGGAGSQKQLDEAIKNRIEREK